MVNSKISETLEAIVKDAGLDESVKEKLEALLEEAYDLGWDDADSRNGPFIGE